MYLSDTIELVRNASKKFARDPRVIQFYDPEKLFGHAIATSLGAEGDAVAWDVYLFFDEDVEWGDDVPTPIEWAHQLHGSRWADRKRLYLGDDLSRRLREIMDGLRMKKTDA